MDTGGRTGGRHTTLVVRKDGAILGALGESGGTAEQDEEIGQIGAKAFSEF